MGWGWGWNGGVDKKQEGKKVTFMIMRYESICSWETMDQNCAPSHGLSSHLFPWPASVFSTPALPCLTSLPPMSFPASVRKRKK